MHKVTSRTGLQLDKPESDDKDVSLNVNMNNSEKDYDFRKNSQAPTRCRFGSASIHLRTREVSQFIAVLATLLVLIYLIYWTKQANLNGASQRVAVLHKTTEYDDTYPLTKPIAVVNGHKYRIGLITDLDQDSKVDDNLWHSFLLKGYFYVYDNGTFRIEMDPSSTTLHSSLSQGGRGMELSELVTFNGEIITVDDRTGVVYKLINEQAVPWVILADGNGRVSKGFKAEWATVKHGFLYVGGLGKEWTSTTGEVLNFNPQYVKRISPAGAVEHIDWHDVYTSIRDEAGYPTPGYMVHESTTWSRIHEKWYFLPRRASKERYDDKKDERRATNTLIVCDETFSQVEVIAPYGPLNPTHGFSSFKFIPTTNDEFILAVRSEEDDGKTASYLTVLDLKGNVIIKEIMLDNYKYEGVEFI